MCHYGILSKPQCLKRFVVVYFCLHINLINKTMAKNASKPASPKAEPVKKAATKKASKKSDVPAATEETKEKRPYKGW